jgi:murein DD-endopeptidase MepM/ murein hydrolase activator NlpD
MADGKVIVSSTELGWGQVISIEHNINGKKVVSDYAHLSKIQAKKGDFVTAGQKIGEV